MEGGPGLGATEDIELPERFHQTTPTLALMGTAGDDSDGEEDIVFYDALGELTESTIDILAPIVQTCVNAPPVDIRFQRIKKMCKTLNEWANVLIGVGVFFLAVIGVVYTTWTAQKDYYEYCYERNQTHNALTRKCKSTLKEGISSPFSWHMIRSASNLASETLRQTHDNTLSALDSHLSNRRPAVVFFFGGFCALLLAGSACCIAIYREPARQIWMQAIRQPETWVATAVARQNYHRKVRKQQQRAISTHHLEQPDEYTWMTTIKSGIAFSDLRRPRRGFTRRDSELESESSSSIMIEEVSDQLRMRYNAEILASYISHVRQCYSPRRPFVYTGYWPNSAGCIPSTILCAQLDLRSSLQFLGNKLDLTTTNMSRQDLCGESGKFWTLHLPSESSLTETLLTVHPVNRERTVVEADHFCDVRQQSDGAACHINDFFSASIIGDDNSNSVIILISNCSKLRYNSLLVQLQDSEEQPPPPVWFTISPIQSESKRENHLIKTDLEPIVLPDLAYKRTSDNGSGRFYTFKHLDMHWKVMPVLEGLFPPVPDLRELHEYWDQTSDEVDSTSTCGEISLSYSGSATRGPKLRFEDRIKSVYGQNPLSNELASTEIDAASWVNNWLLHKLRCSTSELNMFINLLDEPLAILLLEDPDLNSKLTAVWMPNMTISGFNLESDAGTLFDVSHYADSIYQRLSLPSAATSFLGPTAHGEERSALEIDTSRSPPRIDKSSSHAVAAQMLTLSPRPQQRLAGVRSMPVLLAPRTLEQFETRSNIFDYKYFGRDRLLEDSDARVESVASSKDQEPLVLAIVMALCGAETESSQNPVNPEVEAGEDVYKANSINRWLLHRLLRDETEARRFAKEVHGHGIHLQASGIKNTLLKHWNDDGTEWYIRNPTATLDTSTSNSLAAHVG